MAAKSKRIKRTARERTKLRIRKQISGTEERPRISVFRSSKHIYAQLISDESGKTIASASTLDSEVQEGMKTLPTEVSESGKGISSSKSKTAAKVVGLILAKRGQEKNVKRVVFDRNGFSYFGRIKALADGAREGGLEF